MKTSHLLLVCGALLICAPGAARAQEGNAAERAAKIFEQAVRAKTEGRFDEAEKLHNEGLRLQKEAGGERKEEKKPDKQADRQERRKEGEQPDKQADRQENRKLAPGRELGGRGDREPRAEGPAQLDHVRQAIRHLRAAGLNEPAEHLEQQARAMEEKLRAAHTDRSEGRGGGDERSARELGELRGQVQKLTHELEQLRAEAKRGRGEGGERR